MEDKVTKTTKKETTKVSKPKTTTKKKEVNPMTIGDIPQELLAQITAQVMANMSMQKKEVVKEQPKQEKIKYTKTYLNKIKEEEVEVRSVFNGDLIFTSPKSGIGYRWMEKGSTEILSIAEILAMENQSKKFLHNPWVIVDDERVIEALNLKPLYDIISEIEDVDTFVEKDITHIREVISKLPNDFKRFFRNEISMKIENREIRDYLVIEELREILNIPK